MTSLANELRTEGKSECIIPWWEQLRQTPPIQALISSSWRLHVHNSEHFITLYPKLMMASLSTPPSYWPLMGITHEQEINSRYFTSVIFWVIVTTEHPILTDLSTMVNVFTHIILFFTKPIDIVYIISVLEMKFREINNEPEVKWINSFLHLTNIYRSQVSARLCPKQPRGSSE